MRKCVALFLLVICLSGCVTTPRSYVYVNKDQPIESIELLYYPWAEDNDRTFNEFVFIRELETEEISEFMARIYTLETKRVGLGPPRSNYGRYIARVNYQNGDTEYFASRHIYFAESGKQPMAVGEYYFTGDAFEKLFLEYVGTWTPPRTD